MAHTFTAMFIVMTITTSTNDINHVSRSPISSMSLFFCVVLSLSVVLLVCSPTIYIYICYYILLLSSRSMHVHICIHMYLYVYVYTYIYIYIIIHIYILNIIYIYIYIHIQTYAMYTRMSSDFRSPSAALAARVSMLRIPTFCSLYRLVLSGAFTSLHGYTTTSIASGCSR